MLEWPDLNCTLKTLGYLKNKDEKDHLHSNQSDAEVGEKKILKKSTETLQQTLDFA